MTPRTMADLLIRTGKGGDLFGLRRSGWSWRKLASEAPRGVVFHEYLPLAPLKKMIKTADRKIPMADPRLLAELARLIGERAEGDPFPLRMIGMREMNSHNSWMHNTRRLMPDSRRHSLRMSPVDAEPLGLRSGDRARVSSAAGTVTTEVTITEDMVPGTIAMPHGWGHDGGWQRANAAGGANSNLLASEVEALSGTSVLNGIPVRVEAVSAPRTDPERVEVGTA